MIRSQAARVKGACGAATAGATRPLTRPARSQNPAAIRDREQIRAARNQGHHPL